MMACDTPAIEREIQTFIFDCTGERVILNLGTENEVAIETVSHHGSTMLGIFWLKVLQSPNNYPVSQYPYRGLYKARGKHVVTLHVDTVSISVCLEKGRLTIAGPLALDWFAMRFSGVMKAYKHPVTHGQELKEPFDAEQRRCIKNIKKQSYRRYIEDWPDVVVDQDMNVLNARQIMKDIRDMQDKESNEGLPLEPLRGEMPNAAFYIDNLLSSSALEQHLEKLKRGVMTDGATLYAVWASLLDRWFSDPNTKVFIVTPAIDKPCLERLCHIVLNHRLTAALEMLATPLHSNCGRLADIRREVMLTIPPHDQAFTEYKVYNSMVFPQAEFQAKFIAGVCGETVEVLMTSADAKTKHFTAEHSSLAQYQILSSCEFDVDILAPIVASIDK